MPHRLIGAAYVAVIVGGGWAANNYSNEGAPVPLDFKEQLKYIELIRLPP
jgi:hypothetical protein